jgi:hypothetical protein
VGQGGEWVLKLFYIAWGQRCLSDAAGHSLGRRSVSLTCSRGSNSGLGAQVVNNDTSWGLCQAAMVQYIFWRVYLSNAEKKRSMQQPLGFPWPLY